MSFDYFSAALGGLGLFLLGMWLITEGLKVAAGRSLEHLLSSWTSSRLRGLLSGTVLTALVQSSSAVTVAALGFVNTGLLRFERAVWVIFGSNVGTTLTAWLVALVGFKFKVDLLALPLIGIGALLRVFAPVDRYRNLGMALAGFGILFMGIQTLSGGFDSLGQKVSLEDGEHNLLLMVLIGMVLTTLMQSSSASMAVVLTALAGGIVGFHDAAAVVIGANVGTTSTALLATLGATSNARRLAVAHVLFNVLTGVVALVLLVPLMALVHWMAEGLSLADDATSQLALFHTTFNLLGIALMWPLEPKLSAFLLTRFRERQSSGAVLQFLDRNVAAMPDAAVAALINELERVLVQYPSALVALPDHREARQQAARDRRALLTGIGDFLAEVSRQSLTEKQVQQLSVGWRIQHNLVNVDDALAVLDGNGAALARREDQSVAQEFLAPWFEEVSVRMTDDLGPEPGETSFEPFREAYDRTKSALLQAAITGRMSRQTLDIALQDLSQSRRLLEQWHRGLEHYRQMQQARGDSGAPGLPESSGTEGAARELQDG